MFVHRYRRIIQVFPFPQLEIEDSECFKLQALLRCKRKIRIVLEIQCFFKVL
jgi:hypothetical protein